MFSWQSKHKLIMGKIFSTRLELFFYQIFIKLVGNKNRGSSRTSSISGQIGLFVWVLFALVCRRLIPYTYYMGNVVELSGYEGRDKVSYDNDFGAKLD